MKDNKGNQLTPEAPATRKRRGSSAPPGESKAQKFARLANRRVNKALKTLAHVGNLANMRAYDYTREQAQKIIAAINLASKRIEDAFAGQQNNGQQFTV